MQATYIGVVGAGQEPTEEQSQIAYEVGRLIAQRGAALVCGGLGGVMEAAARGAKEAGGRVIGILPGSSRLEANPYLDVALPTGLGEARNVLIVRASDVLIAIGGEFGTLSEIAFALKTGKPVVGIGTWELAKEGRAAGAIVPVDGARTAVEEAFRMLNQDGKD